MSHSQICVSGDVTIHPSAVIAPGVLLQADSNSRIVIAAGACIGMGTILHADQGTLEVGESANIGTGVLFIGSGNIGAHACIGSSCTIFNTDVPKQHVLPSGSLLGDTSRQIHTEVPQQVKVTEAERIQVERTQTDSIKTEAPQPKPPQASPEQPTATPNFENAPVSSTAKLSSEEKIQTAASNHTQLSVEKSEVYGRAYVNQLLVKLMPHKQQLNQSLDDS